MELKKCIVVGNCLLKKDFYTQGSIVFFHPIFETLNASCGHLVLIRLRLSSVGISIGKLWWYSGFFPQSEKQAPGKVGSVWGVTLHSPKDSCDWLKHTLQSCAGVLEKKK